MDQYQQGLEKLTIGDRQGALQAFDYALQMDPQRAEVYAKRAILRRDLGDHNGALADYHQALRLQPTAEAHLGRALLYLAMGEPEAASLDAEQALRLSPNLPAAYNVLATAYCKQRNIPQAIAAYKTAAKLYLAQKDKANAQRCLDTIHQLQVSSASLPSRSTTVATKPWINLDQFLQQAMAKAQQGNYRDALTDLDWLVLTDPQNAKAYCQRGIVYAKVGRRKEAIRDLTEAIRLAPQDSQMLLHRAMVRLELEDARGAIDDLNQLVAATKDPMVYLQRGNAYRQLQDYRRAIEDYSRVLNLAPTMPESYYQRGLAREAFGDRAGALSDLQQAANLWLNQGDGDSYQRTLDEIRALKALPSQVLMESYSTAQPLDMAGVDRCNQLWDRLLSMVSGNRGIAERLLAIAQEQYPGKTEAWYLEKVIADLEGDRR